MKTTIKGTLITALVAFTLQSCTHDVYVDPLGAEKAAYENADAVNGAKLFNNFEHVDAGWPVVIQTDIDQDATLTGLLGWPNPKFANDPTINIKSIANPPSGTEQKNRSFYSCSGCHAYDGMGRDGGYITKKVAIAQPDIATNYLKDCKNWDITKLFHAIKGDGDTPGREIDPTKTANGLDLTLGGQQHPNFSKILSDDKIWDLVKWLKEGAIYNESTALNPNGDLYTITTTGAYAVPQTVPAPVATYSNLGGVDGDAIAGQAFYVAKCMVCHGNGGRGTSVATGPFGWTVNNTNKVQIGDFARTRTPEAIHKIISGQFGSIPWMAATPITRKEMKDLLKALGDPVKFPSGAITPYKN